MRILFILFSLIFICVGCISIDIKIQEPPPVEPKLTAYSSGDSVFYLLEFASRSEPDTEKAEFMKNMDSVAITILDESAAVYDDFLLDLTKLSDYSYSAEKNSCYLTAYKRKEIVKAGQNKQLKAKITVWATGEKYIRKMELKYRKPKPAESMFLQPFAKERPDTGIVIGAYALRIAKDSRSYMPSSEDFRVEIISRKGKRVWNSSEGKNYLTVVQDVLPEDIGGIHKYLVLWNGKNAKGRDVAAGEYIARLIVPAQPNSYIREIKFYWKDND